MERKKRSNPIPFPVDDRQYQVFATLTSDREIIRLLRQLHLSKTFKDMPRLERRWLSEAALTWDQPLSVWQRGWASSILERCAEEIRL